MGHRQNPMVKQPLYCDIQLKLLFHWTADFKKKKKRYLFISLRV